MERLYITTITALRAENTHWISPAPHTNSGIPAKSSTESSKMLLLFKP